jgi:hypothetical protein
MVTDFPCRIALFGVPPGGCLDRHLLPGDPFAIIVQAGDAYSTRPRVTHSAEM